MPALTRVGTSVEWKNSLVIRDNTALTSLRLPALTTVVYYLGITGNTAYPQCAADAILAQLVNFTGAANISGNDTTATCP